MLQVLLLLVFFLVAIRYSISFLVSPCPNCKSLGRSYRHEDDAGERIQVEICTGCGMEISRVPLSEITKAQQMMQDVIQEIKKLTNLLQ